MRTSRLVMVALILGICVASPLGAHAENAPRTQITLDVSTAIASGAIVPVAAVFIVKPIHGPLGLNVISVGSTEFAEVLAGPVYSPKLWLKVAGLGGISQAEGIWRLAATLELGNEHVSSFSVIEVSRSNYFARSEFVWRPRFWAGVGFLGENHLGIGPRLEFNLKVPKAVIRLWGASLYDWSEKRASGLVGLKFDL